MTGTAVMKELGYRKEYFWLQHMCSPKSVNFMDAASPRKYLKIYNLSTTNATLMRLTTIMYLHNTFNLAEDWGVTHRV